MTAFFSALGRFNFWASRICVVFSAFGLALMTVITGYQVFSRYVLNDSPHWSESFCLLLMVYFILFAAASGLRDKCHIGLTFIMSIMPPNVQRAMTAITYIIVGLFGIGMLYYGAQMAATTWSHVIPTLGLSKGVGYLPIPAAGALFALISLEHVLSALLNKEAVC